MHLSRTRRRWKCELEADAVLDAVVSMSSGGGWGELGIYFKAVEQTVKQWRNGERLSFPSSVSTGAASPTLRLGVGQTSAPS